MPRLQPTCAGPCQPVQMWPRQARCRHDRRPATRRRRATASSWRKWQRRSSLAAAAMAGASGLRPIDAAAAPATAPAPKAERGVAPGHRRASRRGERSPDAVRSMPRRPACRRVGAEPAVSSRFLPPRRLPRPRPARRAARGSRRARQPHGRRHRNIDRRAAAASSSVRTRSSPTRTSPGRTLTVRVRRASGDTTDGARGHGGARSRPGACSGSRRRWPNSRSPRSDRPRACGRARRWWPSDRRSACCRTR